MDDANVDRADLVELSEEELQAIAGGTFDPTRDLVAICQNCHTLVNLGNPTDGTLKLPSDLTCSACGKQSLRIYNAPC